MAIESKPDDLDQPLGHEVANGTEMHLSWDHTHGYLLTFPQVDPDLDPLDPIEATVRIGKNSAHSALVVEFAREAAQYTANADEVCQKTGAFAKQLNQEAAMEETRDKVHRFETMLGKEE